jgi:hypothetical protein
MHHEEVVHRDDLGAFEQLKAKQVTLIADSDEVGHAFQLEAGHCFRTEAGRGSDLKPAT